MVHILPGPLEAYRVTKPIFFGAAAHDPTASPALSMALVQKISTNTTVKFYEYRIMWKTKYTHICDSNVLIKI